MGKDIPTLALFDSEYPSSLAILQSLGEKGVGVAVYGSLRWPAGRFSRHCRHFEACPAPLDFEAFQAWLKARLLSGAITRVVPTSDLLAYHCAVLREYFPPEVRQTIHQLEEIERILIKPRFNAHCLSLGLSVPDTWYPEGTAAAKALAPTLPYPVMVKPRSHLVVGMAYRGAVCEDAAAFLAEFRELLPVPGQAPLLARYPELAWPMVQRFERSARQQVYSLTGLRDHAAGIVAEAAVCKTDQWPPGVGIGIHFDALGDAATFEVGRRVVDGFIRHGLFQIELLVQGNSRLPIDLNPRAYQMINFDIARGNDLPWLWYQSTLGEPLRTQAPARLGLSWRRNVFFHLAHWTRLLRGPARAVKWRRYRTLLVQPAVAATAGSPFWARVACELRVFKHPRSLVRPYWRERDADEPPNSG